MTADVSHYAVDRSARYGWLRDSTTGAELVRAGLTALSEGRRT